MTVARYRKTDFTVNCHTHIPNSQDTEYGNKYILLSCAILGILICVASLSVIHVYILLNKVKSNQLKKITIQLKHLLKMFVTIIKLLVNVK